MSPHSIARPQCVNTLRPRQDGRHFADDIFKCIFFNENVSIAIRISLKFVPKGPINNNLALVQIMAWRRPGDKPLSEPMMVSLPTHICVTLPQWVNQKSLDLWIGILTSKKAISRWVVGIRLGYDSLSQSYMVQNKFSQSNIFSQCQK